MTITVATAGPHATAAIAGRLDLRSAADATVQCADALRDVAALTVDLSDVEFIDSSGLGALIGLQRQATRDGKDLRIVPPAGPAREIFTLTRTDRFFTLVGAAA